MRVKRVAAARDDVDDRIAGSIGAGEGIAAGGLVGEWILDEAERAKTVIGCRGGCANDRVTALRDSGTYATLTRVIERDGGAGDGLASAMQFAADGGTLTERVRRCCRSRRSRHVRATRREESTRCKQSEQVSL